MNNITFKKDLLGVQDDLLRFAYKLTSDREEANDLLQETSLKALDNEEKYTPDTNFKGWIYTIMRNIFINNYRKVVRDQTFVDTTDNLYHLNLPRDTAFESTESAYDLKEMHRIVNALPREYKIPFSMHVSGFKYREIAEKLGLPLGTVKSRIYFTRQKLQQDLRILFKYSAYKTSDFHKLRRVQILVVSKERKAGRDNPASAFHGLAPCISYTNSFKPLRFATILFTKIRIAISGYIPLFHLSEALKANQSHPKTANC